MKHLSFFILTLLCLSSAKAQFPLNSSLPPLTLSGKSGGHLDGSTWKLSDSIKSNKVTVIFYVDPDVKDLNEEISEVLSKRNFPKEKVQYVAIINMQASWLPNFAIANALEKKQKKYPNTLYLKDLDKSGVKNWRVPDDENNIIILSGGDRILFSHFGRLPQEKFAEVISLIEQNMN
jgi:predicted transcriptional regulator